MYNYMRALEDRFTPKPNHKQRQELEAKRQEVATLLDKQGRKKLRRLVDAHTMAQEEMALESFIAGFRLAWGIATELSVSGSNSYEQEQLTCLRERSEPYG